VFYHSLAVVVRLSFFDLLIQPTPTNEQIWDIKIFLLILTGGVVTGVILGFIFSAVNG
jgi:hypothetical protein